jgi:hypothetical protein
MFTHLTTYSLGNNFKSKQPEHCVDSGCQQQRHRMDGAQLQQMAATLPVVSNNRKKPFNIYAISR